MLHDYPIAVHAVTHLTITAREERGKMEANERETLSYLAGLLDADGYFSIMCSDSCQKRFGRANPQWFESIGLKQTIDIGPRLLKETFGGCIYMDKPSAVNGKPLFSWRISSRSAAICAARLLPFLRIKRKQARFLIRLGAHKALNGNKRLTQRSVAYRQSLRIRVRALNDTRPPRSGQGVPLEQEAA